MKISLESKKDKKMVIDGNLSLWQSAETDKGPVYTLCEKLNEGKKYTTIFGSIGRYTLNPEEAMALAKGETLEVSELYSAGVSAGAYTLTTPIEGVIVPRTIVESEKVVDGRTYTNSTLKLGVAWPLRKKDKTVYGYKCDDEVFLKEYQLAGFTAHLSPKDCFELKDTQEIRKDGFRVQYKGTEPKLFCKGAEHESTKTVAILWGSMDRKQEQAIAQAEDPEAMAEAISENQTCQLECAKSASVGRGV